MTTNQTIDGVLVPRELLSYWAECLESAGFKDRPAEMRSLLDADKVNNRQMGLMQFVEAHPIKSAARREPIAWYTEDYLTDRSATTYDLATMERWKAKGWPVSPLYIDLPAPVSLVLPSRRSWSGIASWKQRAEINAWNACLDELKRLNPSL